MNKKPVQAATFRIALSAVVIALYWVLMFLTQSFSFGIYQIRIATAFYALALPFPFLVLPLGIANCLGNVLGGMAWDMVGGFIVGIMTAGSIAMLGKIKGKLKYFLIVPIIEFVPSLVVPIWLAPLLSLPYGALVLGLMVGQLVPAILGAALMSILDKRLHLLTPNFRTSPKQKRITEKETAVSATTVVDEDTQTTCLCAKEECGHADCEQKGEGIK